MRVSRWKLLGFRLRVMLVLAAAVALLAGCGGGSGTESPEASAPQTARTRETSQSVYASPAKAKAAEKCPDTSGRNLNVGLDEWETPEIAGILMATERGDFADLGLKVNAFIAVSPLAVIPYVVEGIDAIGVSHEPEVVLAKEEGAPIVILGSLISQPTAAMIWLQRSKIDGIADLKGKTIGIPGLLFQEKFLKKALAQGGLTPSDVKIKIVKNELVPELISGHVDAIFGRSNLQGAELEARGLKPVITRVQELGIPAYDELVLIAQAACVSKRPRMFSHFMLALARGTAAAVKNPLGAAQAVKSDEESNPETSREALKAQLRATLPLLAKGGDVSRPQAHALEVWMYDEGMVQRRFPLGSLLR